MTNPTPPYEVSEEQVCSLWTLVMGQSIDAGCDAIRKALAQEAQRANERAEGLARELAAMKSLAEGLEREARYVRPPMGSCDFRSDGRPHHATLHYQTTACRKFRPLFDRSALLEDPDALGAVILYQGLISLLAEIDTERNVAEGRAVGMAARAEGLAKELAAAKERVIDAFGEGAALEQLVAISHENESRVAELEKQLAEKEAFIADGGRVRQQITDTLHLADARAAAAESALAKLRAEPLYVAGRLEGREEAALAVDDEEEGTHGMGYELGDVAEFRKRCVAAIRALPAPSAAPPDAGKIYCDRCDGCGWYEGGPTLQTKCEDCNGTGVINAK